jgi:NAD(P)-dependent dehydrogenase (short-subunit alcohol dehydrogenase family)
MASPAGDGLGGRGVRQLDGKVAVVTGAAGGIGLALAQEFAERSMNVVLADIQRDALSAAAAQLGGRGGRLAVPTDVSRWEQVEMLARRAVEAFGAVHVVVNNAGVMGPALPLWEIAEAEWSSVLNANVWSVIHGIRAFVPILLEQDEGFVINTASRAGLATARLGAYSVTKHAVVALSEALYHNLASRQAHVGVAVLCPSGVRTGIAGSATYAEGGQAVRGQRRPEEAAFRAVGRAVGEGIEPREVARLALRAMRDQRFYVTTDEDTLDEVRSRAEDIVSGRPPAISPAARRQGTGTA